MLTYAIVGLLLIGIIILASVLIDKDSLITGLKTKLAIESEENDILSMKMASMEYHMMRMEEFENEMTDKEYKTVQDRIDSKNNELAKQLGICPGADKCNDTLKKQKKSPKTKVKSTKKSK